MLAITDAAWNAVGLTAVALVGAAGGIIGIIVKRERRTQDRETTASVTDFEKAYRERGDLIDGYQRDHQALVGMIAQLREDHRMMIDNLRSDHAARLKLVEDREQNCLDALELAEHRIAVLEARSRK